MPAADNMAMAPAARRAVGPLTPRREGERTKMDLFCVPWGVAPVRGVPLCAPPSFSDRGALPVGRSARSGGRSGKKDVSFRRSNPEYV